MNESPNSLNASTGFDLEDYERKLLSTSKSFSSPDASFSFGDADAGILLEAYEKKLLSGQMKFADGE